MSFDSSHWYDRAGAPCYEQTTAKGTQRNTTLADARKLGLVPSVTTVLSVMDKPALTNWKIDQAILAALTLPKYTNELEADWIKRVKRDGMQQAVDAADEGTRIHDAIEQHFKGGKVPEQYSLHVAATVVELEHLFPGVTDWRAEDSFASECGYGGKVDLHSPSTGIVVDFKTKDGDFSDDKKLAYDQNYQLAAYRNGLELPPNVCANIFVSRTHPGKVVSHVWSTSAVEEGLEVFMAALTLWKAIKKFDPSFSMEAAA